MQYEIKNIALANEGRKRIEWADNDMPVLKGIRKRFEKDKPLNGINMSACLHVTAETANLVRTLKAGGANIALCASNPLSTQDDVAASLVKDYEIPVFAIHGEDNTTYYKHIHAVLDHSPSLTMDDGADLISTLHSERNDLIKNIKGSLEETTTGVIRLKAMEKNGALRLPVIAVNDAKTKHLFDNRYGTGQSTIDGIIRATDMLIAGKNIVVAGYGWCGRGIAMRARGMGANIIVTEVEPIKALEAVMDGFMVMRMEEAAGIGDLFCTVTGDVKVIGKEHFELMKDGAMVCNSGHFNVEVDVKGLKEIAVKEYKDVRNNVDKYLLKNGRAVYLLGEGRLINLTAAEGHPACVMDMSFSVQTLTSEYVNKNANSFKPKVYNVPEDIDKLVATLKLESMGIFIDKLTPEQEKYLSSWQEGT